MDIHQISTDMYKCSSNQSGNLNHTKEKKNSLYAVLCSYAHVQVPQIYMYKIIY